MGLNAWHPPRINEHQWTWGGCGSPFTPVVAQKIWKPDRNPWWRWFTIRTRCLTCSVAVCWPKSAAEKTHGSCKPRKDLGIGIRVIAEFAGNSAGTLLYWFVNRNFHIGIFNNSQWIRYQQINNGLGLCSNETHAMRQRIRRVSRLHLFIARQENQKTGAQGLHANVWLPILFKCWSNQLKTDKKKIPSGID